MSTKRTIWKRVSRGVSGTLGSVRVHPWRSAALLTAMVGIMVAVILFGSPEDERMRWSPLRGSSADSSGGTGSASGTIPGPGERNPATTDASSESESIRGSGSGDAQDQGSSTNAGNGGSNLAPGPVAPPVDDPPPVSPGPPVPGRPERELDRIFGETMFPEEYPGLKLVIAFDVDDTEMTATYKSDGTRRFDVARLTVQQAESDGAAQAVREATLDLYSERRTEYAWGGRQVTQAIGLLSAPAEQPAIGFVWRQGRYCIDVTVFSPYPDGIDAGREAALDFIGGMGY